MRRFYCHLAGGNEHYFDTTQAELDGAVGLTIHSMGR